MSARKLSRLAGLVFVLAALVGGVAATAAAGHETGGSAAVSAMAQSRFSAGDIVWG